MVGYAYDAAGNLLSDGYNVMTWDAESRIATAAGATYIYDAEGNRVEKQGGGVTDTIYFGGRPIARLTAGQWTDLIYGPTGLIAEVPGTQTATPMYRMTDHLGNVVGNLTANGSYTNPLDYMPFGQVFSGNTNDPYMFTGKERDTESGLDYLGARYYASSMGRFMSPDWASKPEAVPYFSLDNPQSLNLYSYVGNNPLSKADADGHCGSGPNDTPCSNVKVEAKVAQPAQIVQNQLVGKVQGTGPEGKLVDTVTVNGKPAPDVKVTETNQNTDIKNGKPVSSTLVEGKTTTNPNGQIRDTIGMYHPTDGTAGVNNTIKADFSNNVWLSTDKQTLTLTLPSGQTCSATSIRMLTNASAGGPSANYTLKTTQPVVTPTNP